MENFLLEHLPFWDTLSTKDQGYIREKTQYKKIAPRQILEASDREATAVNIVGKGRIRIFATSEEGVEMNLCRLFPGDVCLLKLLKLNQVMELNLGGETETETELYMIPGSLYEEMSILYPGVREYAHLMVSRRLVQTISMVERIAFTSVRCRLGEALLYHSSLNQSDRISVTHEMLAKDVVTAREVVTRILKQFQKEGMVSLHRGKISLINKAGLGHL